MHMTPPPAEAETHDHLSPHRLEMPEDSTLHDVFGEPHSERADDGAPCVALQRDTQAVTSPQVPEIETPLKHGPFKGSKTQDALVGDDRLWPTTEGEYADLPRYNGALPTVARPHIQPHHASLSRLYHELASTPAFQGLARAPAHQGCLSRRGVSTCGSAPCSLSRLASPND